MTSTMPGPHKLETQVEYPDSDGMPMADNDPQRDLMFDTIKTLEHHYAEVPDVYVSGDILVYYKEGNPRRRVAPDVLVAFGVAKRRRRSYKVWEEGKVPQVVMEVCSDTNWESDLLKATLYYTMGVEEYYIFDLTGERLQAGPLLGMVRDEGDFRKVEPDERGRIRSAALGLELGAERTEDGKGWWLRLYEPVAGRRLPTPMERAAEAERWAATERALREQAEERLRQLEEQLRAAQAKGL